MYDGPINKVHETGIFRDLIKKPWASARPESHPMGRRWAHVVPYIDPRGSYVGTVLLDAFPHKTSDSTLYYICYLGPFGYRWWFSDLKQGRGRFLVLTGLVPLSD